jgi:hypothetical protein
MRIRSRQSLEPCSGIHRYRFEPCWSVGGNSHLDCSSRKTNRGGESVTPNNAFELTMEHRGPRLPAARSSWPTAQLDH